MKQPFDRRDFLKGATSAALTATLASTQRAFAASDTVRVAVVGVGGRGKDHIKGFCQQPGVEVVALCDVNETILRERSSQVETLSGKPVRCYSDMRKLFEAKDIDAVSFATPNHWHALGLSGTARGCPEAARRRDRQHLHGAWSVLQMASVHREGSRSASGAAGC